MSLVAQPEQLLHHMTTKKYLAAEKRSKKEAMSEEQIKRIKANKAAKRARSVARKAEASKSSEKCEVSGANSMEKIRPATKESRRNTEQGAAVELNSKQQQEPEMSTKKRKTNNDSNKRKKKQDKKSVDEFEVDG